MKTANEKLQLVEDILHFILRPFTMPGCYEKVLLLEDCSLLCHKCTVENRKEILEALKNNANYDCWYPAEVTTVEDLDNEEDSILCTHCYRRFTIE